MRPKICLPIIGNLRQEIILKAKEYANLPIDVIEWRIDFFAGYENEINSIIEEIKSIIGTKELISTIRTINEGGEKNGNRFDYYKVIKEIICQNVSDYVDFEIERDNEKFKEILELSKENNVEIIGSFHDFNKTPSREEIVKKLEKAKNLGCHIGKCACMPLKEEDVDNLLVASEQMKKSNPDFPIITMSMSELGKKTRLYGGLYGSMMTFANAGQLSAPGQVYYKEVNEVFDKLYSGKKHLFLIGFMGVGKSTVSRELKKQSGKNEIDTDAYIVKKEGKSISDIFEENGEKYFRDVETNILDELASYPASIISCGGGMAMRDINVKKMQVLGDVVLLTAKPETIYERVKGNDDRPLIRGNMNIEYISELMEKRRPFYQAASTIIVETDGKKVVEIAKEILEKSK